MKTGLMKIRSNDGEVSLNVSNVHTSIIRYVWFLKVKNKPKHIKVVCVCNLPFCKCNALKDTCNIIWPYDISEESEICRHVSTHFGNCILISRPISNSLTFIEHIPHSGNKVGLTSARYRAVCWNLQVKQSIITSKIPSIITCIFVFCFRQTLTSVTQVTSVSSFHQEMLSSFSWSPSLIVLLTQWHPVWLFW